MDGTGSYFITIRCDFFLIIYDLSSVFFFFFYVFEPMRLRPSYFDTSNMYIMYNIMYIILYFPTYENISTKAASNAVPTS